MGEKPPFREVWQSIRQHSGETFETVTGLEFTYEVDGDGIIPSRTDYRLARSDAEEVYRRAPLSGPGEVNDVVRGPSYLWAILHDERILGGRW